MSRLVEMLKNPTGTFDIARISLAAGSLGMVVAPIVFQGIALHMGQQFSAAEFCAGYGAGLGAVVSLGGLAIATKDKGVASALHTTAPMPPAGGQP
jgi:hypothetical protein